MDSDVRFWVAHRIAPRLYYGWVILAVVFVANLSAFSLNPVFGLFITPLEQEFGWERGTIAFGLTFGTVIGAAMAPALGFMIDRLGTRMPMVLFALGAALCYALLSLVERAWQFNVLIGVALALTLFGVGQMMGSININRWFVRRRGRAMGIAMMGASGGALTFIPLCTVLIDKVGWRQSFMVMGGAALVLIVLPTFFLMINLPEQLGLAGHGELRGPADAPGTGAVGEGSWTLREAARTRAFWLILSGIMVGNFAVQGYFVHAIPHMEALGFPRLLASMVWSSFFLTGMLAKFLWGFAIERIGVRWGLVLLFSAESVGMYLLMTARTPGALFFYAVFNGLGHGPFLQLMAMVWAEYFGRRSFGRIYGVVQPAIVIAGSLGPWFAGYVYDSQGSYARFFQLGIGLCLVAVCLFLLAPPPMARRAPVGGEVPA